MNRLAENLPRIWDRL